MAARGEMGKTREQLEEDKKAILAMRVKPLDFEGATVDDLKKRANELWERVKSLEAEKYDLEERRKIQEYDVSKSCKDVLVHEYLTIYYDTYEDT